MIQCDVLCPLVRAFAAQDACCACIFQRKTEEAAGYNLHDSVRRIMSCWVCIRSERLVITYNRCIMTPIVRMHSQRKTEADMKERLVITYIIQRLSRMHSQRKTEADIKERLVITYIIAHAFAAQGGGGHEGAAGYNLHNCACIRSARRRRTSRSGWRP